MNAKNAIKQIKALLEVERGESVLDNGMIVKYDATEVGSSIYIATEDSTKIPAPVGSHVLEDGTTIVVEEEGIIAEIIASITPNNRGLRYDYARFYNAHFSIEYPSYSITFHKEYAFDDISPKKWDALSPRFSISVSPKENRIFFSYAFSKMSDISDDDELLNKIIEILKKIDDI